MERLRGKVTDGKGWCEMKAKTIYIPPKTEEYTGYTIFIMMGTSTSDKSSFVQTEQGEVIEFKIEDKEEADKKYVIPESREERFIDKDLSEFYKKRGYSFKE